MDAENKNKDEELNSKQKNVEELQKGQKQQRTVSNGILKSILMVVVAIVIVAILYFYVVPVLLGDEGGQVTTITESTLVNVVKKAKLNTVEYPYSGYTKVTKDEKDLYYVRYSGSVKAGVDMDKVSVELDQDNKTVRILMPEIEIDDISVDVDSLDTIFIDEKANTENIGAELYKVATDDMKVKVEERKEEINQMAIDNSKRSLKALIEPWLNQVSEDGDYNIVVVAQGEE